jgi:hypothetical protein
MIRCGSLWLERGARPLSAAAVAERQIRVACTSHTLKHGSEVGRIAEPIYFLYHFEHGHSPQSSCLPSFGTFELRSVSIAPVLASSVHRLEQSSRTRSSKRLSSDNTRILTLFEKTDMYDTVHTVQPWR